MGNSEYSLDPEWTVRNMEVAWLIERTVTGGMDYFGEYIHKFSEYDKRQLLALEFFNNALSDITYFAEHEMTRACLKKVVALQLMLAILRREDEMEEECQHRIINKLVTNVREHDPKYEEMAQRVLNLTLKEPAVLRRILVF